MRYLAISLVLASFSGINAQAEGAKLSVYPDRTQMVEDETLTLDFEVKSAGSGARMEAPSFDSPDFDVLSSSQSSQFGGAFTSNGGFEIKNTQKYSFILRPKKPGKLVISNLVVQIEGKAVKSSDIAIDVLPGGAGAPSSPGSGGHGGLRGAGKKADSRAFLIRAETSKNRLIKGEQVIVSYYLYRASRIYSIIPKQYPALPGFLKEDLEMPVLGNRYDWERVVYDGREWERALLGRFAAYPLKEGKLTIDPMSVEVSYGFTQGTGGVQGFFDEDDPFQMFFQQANPQVAVKKSEPVVIDVLPLPEAGKPANFTGGVGDFNVVSSVDRTEVKAGEAVSYLIQVEGRGNVSSIELPAIRWPEGIDLFDTKGRTKSGTGGVGSKTFEYLLIPRKEGLIEIPPIEISFFNPSRSEYVTKKIEGLVLKVLPGDPSKVSSDPKFARSGGVLRSDSSPQAQPENKEADQNAWVSKAQGKLGWFKEKRNPLIFTILGIFLLFFLAKKGKRLFRKWRLAKLLRARPVDFSSLRKKWLASKMTANVFAQSIEESLIDAMERKRGVSVRSQPRERWLGLLAESKDLSPDLISKIEKVHNSLDLIRYSGAMDPSEQKRRFDEMMLHLDEIAKALNRKKD